MMMKLLFIFVLLPSFAWAQGVVSRINNSNQILVELHSAKGYCPGRKVMVISQHGKKFVAFGQIHDLSYDTFVTTMKVDILEIVDNSLVTLGDSVELASVKNFEEHHIPGFNSLSLSNSRKIPSKYKELAYLGVFTAEGQPLEKSETLISLFQIQYGVTDKFGVKVVNALWLDGYVNAGAKYQVINNKYAKLTLNTFGAYKVTRQDWIGQFGGVLTLPQNAKFQNHIAATFTFDPQFHEANATQKLGLFQDSDIRNITEYICDDWNRILYGPVYNVELKAFGGTVSYMKIWDNFHMSLGIATKNFANFSIGGTKGYYYVYDFFWRF
jgi:hypothetical protein